MQTLASDLAQDAGLVTRALRKLETSDLRRFIGTGLLIRSGDPLDILWGYPHIAAVNVKRPEHKPCIFIGSSLKDLRRFPAKVKNRIGFALNEVQEGGEPLAAKALRGFGGRAILELVDDFDGDTYRTVYTIRFADVVYVLHAFQKKAKKGIATPQKDIELIKSRLRDAELHHRARTKKERARHDEAQDRGS